MLGNLFKSTDRKLTRTELIVLITPHVARTDDELRGITQQLREQMTGLHEPASAAPAALH